MEKFRIIHPSPMLAPFVKHYWVLQSDDIHTVQRVIPTGSIELVFHRGYPLMRNGTKQPFSTVCGQSLSYADLKPTGFVDMIAVVFLPFGAKALFDVPLYELSGSPLGAGDVYGPPFRELEERTLCASEDDECIDMIELFLLGRLKPLRDHNYLRMAAAVEAIDKCGGETTVTRLAENVCLSPKQFHRVFREHTGIAPKDFMRVVRFHKTLFTLRNDLSLGLAAIACECGYYDQSHMSGEFKLFSGYTPREYLSVCEPYSDYYSR